MEGAERGVAAEKEEAACNSGRGGGVEEKEAGTEMDKEEAEEAETWRGMERTGRGMVEAGER